MVFPLPNLLLKIIKHIHFFAGCGGSLSINDPQVVGNLSSPNYPANYPVNVECVWTLNVPTGDTIEFVFVDFDIEAHSSCNWDYVELLDGGSVSSSSLGKFCGSSLPRIRRYVSAGNQLVVKMRSDSSQTGRGFTASWKIGMHLPFIFAWWNERTSQLQRFSVNAYFNYLSFVHLSEKTLVYSFDFLISLFDLLIDVWFVCLLIHWFIGWFLDSFVHLFIGLWIYSFINSLLYLLFYCFIILLFYYFIVLLLYCLFLLFHCFIVLL